MMSIGNRLEKLRQRLVDQEIKEAGTYQVVWNGRDARGVQVASGTYIYIMKYGNFKKSHRVTLLK